MNSVIDAILGVISGGITAVVNAIRALLSGFWNIFVWLAQQAQQAESLVYSRWLDLWDRLRAFANTSWTILRWLRDVWVPAFIAALRAYIVAYVNGLINDARNLARGLVEALRQFVVSALSTLESWARDAFRWVSDTLGQVIHNLGVVAARVAALLTDPSVLSTWLVDSLWRVFVQYAEQRAEVIGRWILAKAITATLSAASLVESVLVRIL